MKIAIIGGSGKLGLGFVTRLLETSHELAIGSRDIARAQEAAATVQDKAKPLVNLDAAAWCELAIVTVPYAAHPDILTPLKDVLTEKIVIDTTVPLNIENLFKTGAKSGTSAAEETNAILSGALVFAAFQTISHRILRQVNLTHDVLVAGLAAGKPAVMQLIRDMNLRPIDAGPLPAAGLLERMTALLISINRQNKVKESGLTVTGV